MKLFLLLKTKTICYSCNYILAKDNQKLSKCLMKGFEKLEINIKKKKKKKKRKEKMSTKKYNRRV